MHRTFSGLFVALAFAALTDTVSADPIHVGDSIKFTDAPGTTGGGEFLVTINNADSFLTFCLQRTEYIDYSTTFKIGGINTYVLTDGTAQGGDPVTGQDPISPETAWLYTQFRANTLPGYNYNTANRWVSANDLQNAIWWFERELTSIAPGNPFVSLAQNAVSSGAWSGIGNVRVMNLVFPNGAEAQDQLALITPTIQQQPVPEPATIALLGSGLGLGAWRRYRRRRNAGDHER